MNSLGDSALANDGSGRLVELGAALGRALAASPATASLAGAPREAMRDKGLAHDHIRLVGTGWLARVPKQSQLDLPAAANLTYQAACFARAAPSLHVPRLLAVLPPRAGLERGALVVEEIAGRPARLPVDLPAIARALGALHALPRPADAAPLLAPADPLAAMRDEVLAQGAYLEAARLDPASAAMIARELAALRALSAAPARPATCLINFDAHPGNFLIRADGSAVLVCPATVAMRAPSWAECLVDDQSMKSGPVSMIMKIRKKRNGAMRAVSTTTAPRSLRDRRGAMSAVRAASISTSPHSRCRRARVARRIDVSRVSIMCRRRPWWSWWRSWWSSS